MSGLTAAQRLVRDARGVAQVELLVALPVLVLLLGFVSGVFWLGETRHRAHASARACVWEYALNACDPSQVTLCSGITTGRGAGATGDSGLLAELEQVPLIGSAVSGLFGEPAQAELALAARPLTRATGQRSLSARHTLVCAPPVQSLSDRVKGALCDLATDTLQLELYGCD